MKYFVGLDLGQSQDPSAIAVLEAGNGLVLVYLERAPLGTPYPEVVEWVRGIVTSEKLRAQCGLAVDGTGVGLLWLTCCAGRGWDARFRT